MVSIKNLRGMSIVKGGNMFWIITIISCKILFCFTLESELLPPPKRQSQLLCDFCQVPSPSMHSSCLEWGWVEEGQGGIKSAVSRHFEVCCETGLALQWCTWKSAGCFQGSFQYLLYTAHRWYVEDSSSTPPPLCNYCITSSACLPISRTIK